MRSNEALDSATDLPTHETVRLLMAASGRSHTDVMLGFDLTDSEYAVFESFVQRRRGDEPLQYIEGTVDFGPVELAVDPRVLIPRPETEYIFTRAVETAQDPKVIVDLCTGSGNLAVALAATFPTAKVFAVDLSPDAAAVASENAASNGVAVEVLVGDLFEPLPDSIVGHIDLLVANPPYLAADELASVPPDVLAEPATALVAGPRGDEIVARIAADAASWLAPGGAVLCEISEFEPERSLGHFSDLEATVEKDLTGRDRFVIGYRRFR